MPGIKNKVIAITGASSGIGAATASLLAQRGAKLVLGARSAQRLQRLTAQITEAGGTAVDMPLDVRCREQMRDFVRLACERYGRLDVLIGNAGIGPISALDALRTDDWEAMVDIHIKGVLWGIAAALPVFRSQGAGHFIHTASTAAHRIVPNMAVYAATKGAVRAISEGLRQEAGDKLRVTVVSPGITRTSFSDSITDPAIRAQIAGAMDTTGIAPEAIARAMAFAIEQPADVDVGEIIVRPTAQA